MNEQFTAARASFPFNPPNVGREEDPMKLLLSLNQARIGARTTWVPYQDRTCLRYVAFTSGPYHTEWHSS